ncbi:long-chain fatty acid--CoA ligase [Paraburkholderia sp. Ac-20340]|uniref:acyl-CoA synthetase n=1 Tax=Paraburkholderia sp. Ac-20340 TaxID=2703888 RepID=UPI001981CED8|nr:long-chain fatty acid--CoA ligase [Paraburkholderia sp. Ac-20340]MBN3853730.1 long-chain fatty acid--CoA ligase [Paraburkholderia sp. Ac-20340]
MFLTSGVHRAVQQKRDQVATIFGDRRRTWRELADRVARLAGALQALGMRPGDRVGMLAMNSDRYLEYVLATWWGGGVINPVNVRWSVAEIVYSLDDCDTGMLLVDDAHLPRVAQICAQARRQPLLIHAGDGAPPRDMLSFEALIASHAPVEDANRGGDDLASIMYTGGTTGLPKGVMQTHLNLWSSAMQRLAEAPALPGVAMLHAAPFFHMAGLGRAIMQWIAGEPQSILPGFDAGAVLRAIREDDVGEVQLVPTMIQAVLDHPDFARTDFSRVQRLTYGAAPISAALLEQVIARMPGVGLFNSYGLTEACSNVCSNPPVNHGEAGRRSGLYRSVGRCGPAVRVKIVDTTGREVPRGSVGEIVVRGPNITAGYWNKPQETAKALRDGWLHTGDGGYMDDAGYLFVVDRIKDMIVSGGENVYSAEVENAIAQHPAVAACAVIGVPHEKWGEAVHAVVVLKPDHAADADTIRAHCRQFIAGYKCPKTVEFRDALPLSAAGKVLKRELRPA